jgi:hypothetical protein
MSELDNIIPPEIKDDEFYFAIQKLASEQPLQNVLEIGSSAGGGSTEAFVNGLSANPSHPRLFCLEVSRPRFAELAKRYEKLPFVRAYNASSVPISKFMTPEQVGEFYRTRPTQLNQFPLERVLGWLAQDIRYVTEANVPQNGIQLIKQDYGITAFDLVLIDGSAFTGSAELDEVIGSRIIMLDDVNDIKCLLAYERLKCESAYQLAYENLRLRNGFAIFFKKG